MANALYIDTSGFGKVTERLKGMEKELAESVDQVLNANALAIAKTAKQLAPVGVTGLLHSAIFPNVSEPLKKHIFVNADYAAYIEFGTGSYAANYAGSLPQTWQEFAAQFKGKGSGKMPPLDAIEKWVAKKIVTSNITETKRRKHNKSEKAQIKQIAYLIARSILKNGIKAHPFLFPAYEQQRPQILKDMETVLKSL